MADFMRRDHHRCQRTAVIMIREQAHGLALRIVVIADRGFLDLDGGQPHAVEEVAGEFAARAGEIRPLGAMPRQHGAHPERGQHGKAENEQQSEDDGHGNALT